MRFLATVTMSAVFIGGLVLIWKPHKSPASTFSPKAVYVEEEIPPFWGQSETPKPKGGRRGDVLKCIREIESGGDYTAVSRTGKYRNAYQMSTSFWLRHGGDPAYAGRHELAPPEMQDAVALRGLRDQGLGAWPVPARWC